MQDIELVTNPGTSKDKKTMSDTKEGQPSQNETIQNKILEGYQEVLKQETMIDTMDVSWVARSKDSGMKDHGKLALSNLSSVILSDMEQKTVGGEWLFLSKLFINGKDQKASGKFQLTEDFLLLDYTTEVGTLQIRKGCCSKNSTLNFSHKHRQVSSLLKIGDARKAFQLTDEIDMDVQPKSEGCCSCCSCCKCSCCEANFFRVKWDDKRNEPMKETMNDLVFSQSRSCWINFTIQPTKLDKDGLVQNCGTIDHFWIRTNEVPAELANRLLHSHNTVNPPKQWRIKQGW